MIRACDVCPEISFTMNFVLLEQRDFYVFAKDMYIYVYTQFVSTNFRTFNIRYLFNKIVDFTSSLFYEASSSFFQCSNWCVYVQRKPSESLIVDKKLRVLTGAFVRRISFHRISNFTEINSSLLTPVAIFHRTYFFLPFFFFFFFPP